MPYSFREIHKRLLKLGFSVKRQGKGSHVIFSNGKSTIPIPHHGSKDISKGVEKNVLKLLDIGEDDFRNIR